MDIVKILVTNYPGKEWALDGSDYSGLNWLDDSPKPTEEELLGQWVDVEYKLGYAEVERQRQEAYQNEADPLFFKSKRGKATEKEWLDKINEIDARFPYPEPPKGKK